MVESRYDGAVVNFETKPNDSDIMIPLYVL
jgi:hypothetical protein